MIDDYDYLLSLEVNIAAATLEDAMRQAREALARYDNGTVTVRDLDDDSETYVEPDGSWITVTRS